MKYRIEHHSNQACPDELFGRLVYNGNRFDWDACLCFKNKPLNRACIKVTTKVTKKTRVIDTLGLADSTIPFIVLVLESPHISEFDQNGKAIGPAQGKTGAGINLNLPKVLTRSKSIIGVNGFKEKYNVYIVNAVNKQCSLGLKPICKTIRDINFAVEWFKNSKSDGLKQRLSNILATNGNDQNNIILNLCTKGGFLPLQDFVDNLLKQSFYNVIQAKGYHPSSSRFAGCILK